MLGYPRLILIMSDDEYGGGGGGGDYDYGGPRCVRITLPAGVDVADSALALQRTPLFVTRTRSLHTHQIDYLRKRTRGTTS